MEPETVHAVSPAPEQFNRHKRQARKQLYSLPTRLSHGSPLHMRKWIKIVSTLRNPQFYADLGRKRQNGKVTDLVSISTPTMRWLVSVSQRRRSRAAPGGSWWLGTLGLAEWELLELQLLNAQTNIAAGFRCSRGCLRIWRYANS